MDEEITRSKWMQPQRENKGLGWCTMGSTTCLAKREWYWSDIDVLWSCRELDKLGGVTWVTWLYQEIVTKIEVLFVLVNIYCIIIRFQPHFISSIYHVFHMSYECILNWVSVELLLTLPKYTNESYRECVSLSHSLEWSMCRFSRWGDIVWMKYLQVVLSLSGNYHGVEFPREKMKFRVLSGSPKGSWQLVL